MNETRPKLIVILGDQLSTQMAALRQGVTACDVVLMAEVRDETRYVPHHPKKIAFVLSAMRHFAQELEQEGWRVRYVKLDDPDNTGSLVGEVDRARKALGLKTAVVTEPGEYRLCQAFSECGDLEVLPDDRFIADHAEFRQWAEGRKQLRMEFFYREMRRKTGLLMNGDAPEGGKWNFDTENRKPAKSDFFMPQPVQVEPDEITTEVLDLVDARFSTHFGTLRPFWFAVTRDKALQALEHFVETALPHFGDYQDAMLTDEPFLYHSVLAQYLNAGLLLPLEICLRVERAYYEGQAPLNAVEGYIRQIIGWREFVRGIYWMQMPGYTQQNFLNATRPLPAFYWTADTDMACMKQAILQTRDEAYAHHIQRLMVTGNFAMLAGIDPAQVHEWYLAVYADAYEWVEAPNVIGMSQFADGGLLGSKPYAASGNYINKMSDHCGTCRYDVKQKTGPNACPFNPLYWDFLVRNAEKLRDNPRLGHAYRTWGRMAPDKQQDYLESAKMMLDQL
ncbi:MULTISPECIES: cryptochrome/photolyase family protein [unclassified Ruegeria]|uniref:cryptochrome/photolyase family protein n=1 Tax=unclassified Ruegeria TaxID=2625375 RepID=UPI001491E4FD|nr:MULTISPECIES: cryptochrome/photolyase family protein [unclassified Ruegeria]NOD88501.1 cryptochrome/photolyase family protein [Ruegeria sp. HKCCD4318]NOE13410.1 cryptochrome/photolyase family protein [Ruegeria sp. HKCCD4318-2]NOG11048.1 cryptochrome/photolyase family protein [Ruegeria sp. HKCCD4315]